MASVSQLAKRAGTSLLPDHVAFLATHAKSLHRESGEVFPAWQGPGKSPRRVEESDWPREVVEVFGSNRLKKFLAGYPFWHRGLLRHAVPIANCGNGDVVVQVVNGRCAGHVLLVSHDAYCEFFEQLATLGRGKVNRDLRDSGVEPVLKRHGYRGGEPSTDQVVAVLLHGQFDGAERIARSFSDFYQQLYLGRLPDRRENDEGGYAVTEVDWELSALASDRKQLFILGDDDRRACVLAMGPDGSPTKIAQAPGRWISSLLVHKNQLLHANPHGVRALRGGTFRELLRGRFAGIGCDGAGGLWAVGTSTPRQKPSAGSPTYRYSFFHSKDGVRFRSVNDLDLDSFLEFQGSSSKGLLLTALEAGTLYLVTPAGTIRELDTPRDEYFTTLPIMATRKKTLIAGDEWRSTDMGKTWKRPKSVAGVQAKAIVETSTGAIVILGETARGDTRLLVSRDDGVVFSMLPIRIKGSCSAITEFAGSLVLTNGTRLVRLPLP